MIKLPRAIRFFSKPDHIAFLVGYGLIIIGIFLEFVEIKIVSIISFAFTLAYELFEISKGNRDIWKLDHVTFVLGFCLLIISFCINEKILIYLITILFTFTLLYEIYRVRINDLKNRKKK